MNNRYLLIIILPLVVWCNLVNAQSHTGINLYVATNAYSHAAGNILTIQVFQKTSADFSSKAEKVVYLSLNNNVGKMLLGEIALLDSAGQAQVGMYLPDTLASGEYHLKAATKQMLLANKEFKIHLYITNRFDNKESLTALATPFRSALRDSLFVNKTTCITQENSLEWKVSSGEEQATTLQLTNKSQGETLKGIVRCHYFPETEQCLDYINPSEKISFNEYNPTWIAETKGRIITGLIEQNKLPLANKTVLLSIPGEKLQVRTAITNQNGRFSLLLPVLKGKVRVYIHVYEPVTGKWIEDANILLDPIWAEAQQKSESQNGIPLPDLDSLNNTLCTIQKAYQKPSKDTTKINDDTKSFYPETGEGKFIILCDHYQTMNSFYELVNETVPYLKVKQVSENTSLYLYNQQTNTGNYNPFLFVDGVPVHRVDLLQHWGTNEIERIEVQPAPRVIGEMVFEKGIVLVKTKKGNFHNQDIHDANSFIIEGFSSNAACEEWYKNSDTEPNFARCLHLSVVSLSPGESIFLPIQNTHLHGKFKAEFVGESHSGEGKHTELIFNL